MNPLSNLFFLLVALVLAPPQIMAKESSVLKASLFEFEQTLDTKSVRSASSYILLKHLTAGLVSFDRLGQIQGQLAQKWDTKDQTTYVFTLKENLKFSDGSPLRASHVQDSINRLRKDAKNSIHFDFESVESVKADGLKLTIQLKNKTPRFIQRLTHPEFGVIHPEDLKKARPSFQHTSGPYQAQQLSKEAVSLKKNPYYKTTINYPDEIQIRNYDQNEIWSALFKNELEFSLISRDLTKENFDKIKNSEHLQMTNPHIGFTHWLSINPSSKLFKSKVHRQAVFNLLKSIDFEKSFDSKTWELAKQLYLPDGSGRLTEREIATLYSDNTSLESLKDQTIHLLSHQRFVGLETIKAEFKKQGIQLEVTTYNNQSEYHQHIKDNTFDLIEINNDFSSLDLTENLVVSFNKNRPLIFLGEYQQQYETILEKMKNSFDIGEKSNLAKEISYSLLSDRLIFPVAYKRTIFVHSKNLKLGNWSTLYPEVAFWKAEWIAQ